jgi:hypothetical protein
MPKEPVLKGALELVVAASAIDGIGTPKFKR